MVSSIRFGLIGCGAVASTHAKAIASLPNAKLVAVVGQSPQRLASFAEAWGLDGYTDLELLLQRKDIDAVAICTPSGSHGDIAIRAAGAGKHAMIEKPIDISLSKADETIAAFRSRGLRLGVISQRRFDLGVVRLKALLEAGELGRPVLASACVHWYRDQAYYDSGGWRGTWSGDGGGVLINQGIHTVDLLLHLLGPVAEVAGHTATMTHERMETEDTAVALLKFANGAMGTLSCTTSAYPGSPVRIEVIGSKGSALLEGESLTRLDLNNGNGSSGVQKTEELDKQGLIGGESAIPSNQEAFVRQYEDFVDAIIRRREPTVAGEAGREALALVLEVYRSSKRSGQRS